MALQVVVDKIAVTKKGDIEDTIVHRGAMVPDWVDDFTKFVLAQTGMAKHVAEPDAALIEQGNPPAPVQLQEHAPQPEAEALTPKPAAKPAQGKTGK